MDLRPLFLQLFEKIICEFKKLVVSLSQQDERTTKIFIQL